MIFMKTATHAACPGGPPTTPPSEPTSNAQPLTARRSIWLWLRHLKLGVVLLALAAAVQAGVREVNLSLPLRSKFQLTGHERLAIGPFIREVRGDEAPAQLKFDVALEFERHLRKLLRKEGKFILLPVVEGVRVPTTDPLQLTKESEFWRDLGTKAGADYIVAGSIDFQIQDTTQPKMESYVSPIDGRTYYRQIMVEQTGFSYAIMLDVYHARTGALVFQEPFKDQQEREESSFDEFTGMFANLYALENKLVGVFVPRTVKSKRLLFVP
jgi:hypothetical protein